MTIQNSLLQNWSWFVDYTGPGSRIWLTWLPTEVGVEILQVHRQFIHCKLTNKRKHTTCLITVLYGDYEQIHRRELWRNIVQISVGIRDESWLLTGDFNAVMDESEVNGNAADTSTSMAEFQECVATAELIQLPFTGAPFTWHNCSEGGRSLWKRLDRMLVNEAWLTIWPLTKYLCSTPRTSDHAPLILQGHEIQREVTMFRFENFLTKIPGFLSCVEGVWRHHIVGTSMYALTRKLKALKPVLRGIRKKQGDLSQSVSSAANFLAVAQRLNQEFQHDSVLILLEKCCRIVYCKAVNLEVNMLKQRAKLRWLKGGDQCSKIFYRKINARRAAQRVYQIQNSEGTLLTDYPDIVKEIVSYYQHLFGGTRRTDQVDLSYLKPFAKHVISDTEADQIISPIQMQEIKDAIFDIEEDSAPGPDGFSSGFFKASWSVIGEEVCKAVLEFFDSNRILKQINNTLLVLIPKVNMPTKVADFRPISCCNVIYKVITKIMVKRMQLVLDKLIDNTQNAFVPGRNISTNVLLAQELLAGYNQRNCLPGVQSSFFLDLSEWWSSWFFPKFSRVATRGSYIPLSLRPCYGIISSPSTTKIRNDTNFNFHWRCKELGIVNLSFADDILLFCKADLHSVSVLKEGLLVFKELSGLQANAQKIRLLSQKLLFNNYHRF
ncbi:UNVERIFIED_CONTAM: hypothetical protein Scaly_3130200 [Sesamum calycinum]|uniref:Reverse transcriptase domain-containing protein n=1 Tax=Sesamum calycinum TaxID=2727403 RepID=A0AAW2JH58_9LAMI